MGATRKKSRVMVVDDDDDILSLLSSWLDSAGFTVETATSGEQALERIKSTRQDLVITDLFMQGMSGMELLQSIHSDNPLFPVIMLSGQARIPDAVKAMHLGSAAFLTKPVEKDELIRQVRQTLQQSASPAGAEGIAASLPYKSKAMADLVEMAESVAGSDITVFISGETGTGKEVLARAIHHASPRCKAPFIAVNCGAIPEQLLESELFGHEKGAFTGAGNKHEGLFQAANGGTLFLDEIGDMPLMLQVKLLRVLQDFEVRPVGSVISYPINVRIISATHRKLEEAVEQGEFREDLYYRLKVVPMHMPRLAERREDIPLLVNHFMEQNGYSGKRYSPEAMNCLTAAPWPGNIRQLMNVMDICVTLCKTDTIPESLVRSTIQDKPDDIKTLKDAKFDFEENYLTSVLTITNGHVANAAKIAGRNRTEFYKLLNQHNIDPAEFRNSVK